MRTVDGQRSAPHERDQNPKQKQDMMQSQDKFDLLDLADEIDRFSDFTMRLSGADRAIRDRDAYVSGQIARQIRDLDTLRQRCDWARLRFEEGLSYYRVTLKEYPSDRFQIAFECWAACAEHAYDQTEEVHPGCVLGTAVDIGWHPGFANVDSLALLMRLLAEDRCCAIGDNHFSDRLRIGADAVQGVKKDWADFESTRQVTGADDVALEQNRDRASTPSN